MRYWRRNIIAGWARSCTKLLSLLAAILMPVIASGQSFSGPFAGVEVGRQQIIGGSLVDSVDTLTQEDRLVVTGFAGWRFQVQGFVLGGELGVGRTDGDLLLATPSRALLIDYKNSSQWHWGLHAGHTLGSRTLLFGYVSEASRSFDVTISRLGRITEQQDEQGILRYGGGLEQHLIGPLHVRGTLGTTRADFGDRPTNIEVERRLESAVALVFQF